jgi:hypothetical protein
MDASTAKTIAEQFGRRAAANARAHLGTVNGGDSIRLTESELAEMLSIAFQRGYAEGSR